MSICSMTGYAVATRDTTCGTFTVEIKSVNSRFLDLQFRLHDDLRAVEPALRELMIGRVNRGKVECRVSFSRANAAPVEQKLNSVLLDSLSALQQQLRQRFPDAAQLSIAELLRWPGMIEEAELGQDHLHTDLQAAMRDTLNAFIDSRMREGTALQEMLLARVIDMEKIVARIAPLVPQLVEQFQQKSIERLQEALGNALQNQPMVNTALSRDEMLDRIRQEVTLYAIRIDIAEELSRLAAHLNETRSILAAGGQVGKRLDFMMQELNREANTIGSKAALKELADAAMALKLLIEQMREQVQNLE